MLRIYGASDDLVELEGIVSDEVNHVGGGPVRLRIGDDTGGLFVVMKYSAGPGAVWSARIEQIEDDVPIPWPVTVRTQDPQNHCGVAGYTVIVEIGCPEGTPVFRGKKRVGDG